MKIIGSVYEHDAVDRWLNVRVKNLEELEAALQEYTNEDKLVFWMGVNNVTGKVFDIESIGNMAHKYNAFYICDATALWSHAAIPQDIDEWCDCIIQSSHKIGTELGIGCMWLSDKFDDWLGDFKLYGTPNLAGAMAIADSTEDAVRNVKQNIGHWVDLYCYLKRELEENGIEYSNVIGDAKWGEWTPAINAIRLHGVNTDALQQYLASKQIYVGLGASACAESHDYRVLNAFGLSNKEASEVIRISFGENSNAEDVREFASAIKEFKEKFIR